MRRSTIGIFLLANLNWLAAISLAFAVIVMLALPGCGYTASTPAEPALIEPDELAVATDLAANYLVAQLRDDGAFVYRINIDPAIKVKPKYNSPHISGHQAGFSKT